MTVDNSITCPARSTLLCCQRSAA